MINCISVLYVVQVPEIYHRQTYAFMTCLIFCRLEEDSIIVFNTVIPKLVKEC